MFFEVCSNPQSTCVMFYPILLRLLSNNFIGLFDSFEDITHEFNL